MSNSTVDGGAKRRLKVEAARLRGSLFPLSSDEAWRRERLYRYPYWREHREHAAGNLVGSRDLPDLEREISRWQDYARRLGKEEVLGLLGDELEQRYGRTWSEAVEEGTSSLLATVHMPVWHEATGSLLPAMIGLLLIFDAETCEDPELGWSYGYGRPETRQKLSLILYDLDLNDVEAGLNDRRVAVQFESACRDIRCMAEANGDNFQLESLHGPVLERMVDPQGREISFASLYAEVVGADGVRRGEAVSMRGFRRHFLKIRYARHGVGPDEADKQTGLEEINSDLAEFVAHFTSQAERTRGSGCSTVAELTRHHCTIDAPLVLHFYSTVRLGGRPRLRGKSLACFALRPNQAARLPTPRDFSRHAQNSVIAAGFEGRIGSGLERDRCLGASLACEGQRLDPLSVRAVADARVPDRNSYQ